MSLDQNLLRLPGERRANPPDAVEDEARPSAPLVSTLSVMLSHPGFSPSQGHLGVLSGDGDVVAVERSTC